MEMGGGGGGAGKEKKRKKKGKMMKFLRCGIFSLRFFFSVFPFINLFCSKGYDDLVR
jgi:hypothetical protein